MGPLRGCASDLFDPTRGDGVVLGGAGRAVVGRSDHAAPAAPRDRRSLTSPDSLSDEERARLRDGCERSLRDHGLRSPTQTLAELGTLPAEELTADEYGTGGVVATLESEV